MACNIILDQQNGWQFDFYGCDTSQNGSVTISHLETELNPHDSKYYHRMNYVGTATDGSSVDQNPWIEASEIEDVPNGGDLGDSANINPTKVFNWIVKKAKGYLCPQCA